MMGFKETYQLVKIYADSKNIVIIDLSPDILAMLANIWLIIKKNCHKLYVCVLHKQIVCICPKENYVLWKYPWDYYPLGRLFPGGSLLPFRIITTHTILPSMPTTNQDNYYPDNRQFPRQ